MHLALPPITESDLRAFVRRCLSERASAPDARVFEEFCIERGAARVDLTIVGERLEAFELKSDFDDFRRLHNQIHAYNRVFDRITLVTGAALHAAALEVIPRWWGVWAVHRLQGGDLSVERVREAEDNPRQEARSLATLLWREEAAAVLLDETGESPPKRASRARLCESIAEHVTLQALRRQVARKLVSRVAVPLRAVTRTTPAPSASAPSNSLPHHEAICDNFQFPD